MKIFVKSILAAGIISALCLSNVNAASYQVIDTGEVSSLEYTLGQKENIQGEKAISGSGIYNFPVQYQYLDDDDFDDIETLAKNDHENVIDLNDLEDLTALKAGNPTGNDLAWVIRYLSRNKGGDPLYQKVADTAALTNLNGQSQEMTIFDTSFADGQLTRSTTDIIHGITNEGWFFGEASAPYLPMDYTEDDGDEVEYWIREFSNRAFLSTDNGTTIKSIIPVEANYGGESGILAINDNRVAVGFASTKLSVDSLEDIADDTGGCADTDNNFPLEHCLQVSRAYHTTAYKWSLDANGDVISSEELGQLVTPHEDDERIFVSKAQAINNSGVAVGYVTAWHDETETTPSSGEGRSTYAVAFKDGQVLDFTQDHSKYIESFAYDINDKGFAVGQVFTDVKGTAEIKFYYADTNADEITMVLPTDFFSGSASTARAINENGFIVGDGEVETSSSPDRRRHGFLYSINDDTFTNLNDFLPCDSAYTIVEARDINDNNEIFATAVVKTQRRDAKGELMRDADGEVDVEDVIRAVKLVPIDGEIEGCSSVVEEVKRKGGGFGLLPLFAMMIFGLRRKFSNKLVEEKKH